VKSFAQRVPIFRHLGLELLISNDLSFAVAWHGNCHIGIHM
jgi:hypothetical protein